jgi:DNA-binding NarL/FixJ family response regulator
VLERRGYDVVAEAGCAASALDAVERFAPHAVLLDVRLGDDDGFEVCATLTRAQPGLAVLLASTGAYEGCDELVVACGARGFIRKTRLVDTDLGQFWPSPGHQTAPDQPAIRSVQKRGRQEA